MRKNVLFVILIVYSPFCFAQKKVKSRLILSPGISYQRQFMPELNLMLAKSVIEHGGNAIWGPRIGIESNFSKNDLIVGTKLGYEMAGLIVCFRGNAISYFNQSKIDLRLLPEAGISLFGAVNLTYGYNFPLLDYRIPTISNHRIALTVNLDFEIWKAL